MNTTACLWKMDLNKGCVTGKGLADEWIRADFGRPAIISKMEIAPFGTYVKELNGAVVEMYNKKRKKWQVIHKGLKMRNRCIGEIYFTDLKATTSVRIRKSPNKHVSVGFWKIYGI